MPIHTNAIDVLTFEDIQGVLQPRAQEIEVVTRPGKDDSTFILTGVRARPVQIVTMHYVASFTAAKDAISAYVAYIDGNAYEIVQHSVSFGNFRILGVNQLSARATANVVGSIIPGATVQQYCQWTVLRIGS